MLADLPRVELVVADRGYRGLGHHVPARHGRCFEVRHWDTTPNGFKPIRQVWRVEDCFAQLGRWLPRPARRSRADEGCLARSFEGTTASATTSMFCEAPPRSDYQCQVAAVGLLLSRLR